MEERLFVAVIGERNSGKSTTWNTLFGRPVKTGHHPHVLKLNKGESAEVFLISGSNEEKDNYAAAVLNNVDCRIVLCSVQYVEEAFERTWEFVFGTQFDIYAQWLNPGFSGKENFDRLGMLNILLEHNAVVSKRDGRKSKPLLTYRVEEIREFIHGWAAARDLVSS